MVDHFIRWRKQIIVFFAAAFFASIYFISTLHFSFDFEQYFPQGDPDLQFFQSFIKNFETDDNFLLVGVGNKGNIFEQNFLRKFDSLTEAAVALPYVHDDQSLTKIQLPVKTFLGVSAIPVLHIEDTSRYEEDKQRITHDPRFVKNFISEDASSTVLFLKTKDRLSLPESEVMMQGLDSLMRTFNFSEYHYLGRANFQKELVWMEKREVAVSTAVAAVLVALIIIVLFRRWRTMVLALLSIGFSMLFFFGILGLWGRELSAMAALYPVLMVIIGTSDFIHMLSKYIDELRFGHTKDEAIARTVKEIGLATLMTAVTTAVGFATLVTSRITPIQDFGINAAVGVMVAYVTVLLFTTAVLPYFSAEQLQQASSGAAYIEKFMEWVYQFTKTRARTIAVVAIAILGICIYGTTRITTNYNIMGNMPRGQKITEDFSFFEKVFAGFRPLEYAVFAENGRHIDNLEVLKQVEKVENYLSAQPAIRSVTSPTIIYKSLNLMNNSNRAEAYKLPDDSLQFNEFKRMAEKLPKATANILQSKDGTKARIATRILDLGADSVMAVGDKIDAWIAANTDKNIATFRRTGTGYIIDKNAMYVRSDLVEGIFWEVGLIALLMAFMLRNVRMIFIFLIPNLFPLIFAGALVGYMGVPLDAGISMIFTVVFGIAIDDTIHFLSTFNINRGKGETVDEALHTTLIETGKPVCITTIILFFGFLVMIFSIHPPSVTIGKIIAVTLVTALMSDLFINPILLRWWIRDKKVKLYSGVLEGIGEV